MTRDPGPTAVEFVLLILVAIGFGSAIVLNDLRMRQAADLRRDAEATLERRNELALVAGHECGSKAVPIGRCYLNFKNGGKPLQERIQ